MIFNLLFVNFCLLQIYNNIIETVVRTVSIDLKWSWTNLYSSTLFCILPLQETWELTSTSSIRFSMGIFKIQSSHQHHSQPPKHYLDGKKGWRTQSHSSRLLPLIPCILQALKLLLSDQIVESVNQEPYLRKTGN
jgi:hypothetical protein